MANPAVSLSRLVHWHDLLSLLGIKGHGLVLPAILNCPLCQQSMLTISEDHLLGSQWFHCRCCKKSGDMIQLAAHAWRLTLQKTIERLCLNGYELPTDQASYNSYLEQHTNYRRRINRLFDDSVQGFQKPSCTIQNLRSKLGLRYEIPHQRWQNGPGQLLGAIDKTAVERCFAPRAMQHADALQQKSSPSAHAIFHGKDWGDVLVVPYYDQKWRIRAYLFIGRDGNPKSDYVIKLANLTTSNRGPDAPTTDLGLALHPAVLDIVENWDHSVVAIKDPAIALRLQMRNFEQSLHPLPIVHWHDTDNSDIQTSNKRPARTTHAWQIVGNNKIIFWMPEFCIATLRQAIAQDALISTVGPRDSSGTSLKEYIWKTQPRDLIRHVQKGAKPWPKVLSKKLEQMTKAQCEQLFHRLQLSGEDIQGIAKRCGPQVLERMNTIMADRRILKTVEFDGYTVQERDNKWYALGKKYKQSELISNAVLRIDQVIYQKKSQNVYYRGRILYRDHELPFCEPADLVRKNATSWMRDKLIQANQGLMYHHPTWTMKLHAISQRFLEPQLQHIPGTIGWDREDHQFVFPGFTIAEQGQVEVHDASLFPQNTPARELQPPRTLSPEELERPSYSDQSAGAVFWATATAVLANILAPVCGEATSGIMLSGGGAQALGRKLVQAFGCRTTQIRDARETRLALQAEQEHSWPIFFDPAYQLQRRYRKQLIDGHEGAQRNCVLLANSYEAPAKALEGSWQVITAERAMAAKPDVVSMAKRLLPTYLQDLAKRHYQLEHWDDPADTFTEEVLRDLAYYVDSHHGNPEDVISAREVLWPRCDGGHALPLVDLLAQFIRTGQLSIEHQGDRRDILTQLDGGGLLVPEKVLQKLLQQIGIAMPNPINITGVLMQENVLIEEHKKGWVIRQDWFQQRQRDLSIISAGPIAVTQA